MLPLERVALQKLIDRVSTIEGRLSQKDAGLEDRLAHVTRECEYLRVHVNLLEARLELTRPGLRGSPVSNSTVPEEECKEQYPASSHDEPVADNSHRTIDTDAQDLRRHYYFQESIWDTSAIIWTSVASRGPDLVASVVLFLNVVAQGIFCIIIGDQFTDQDNLPREDHMRYWRAGAHETGHADPITGTSLVARVCNLDDSLMVANGQLTVVQHADQYLSHLTLLSVPTGVALFMLSWVMWTLVAMNEALAGICFVEGMWSVPRGKTSLAVTPDSMTFLTLGWGRVIFVTIVALARLAVCGALFASGTLWLAAETNVRDLLLNASALGFVMDMDDLLFRATMPAKFRAIIRILQPVSILEHRSPGLFKNIGFRPFVVLLSMGSTLVFLYMQPIKRNLDTLEALEEVICGGQTDFVWRYQETFSAVLARTSPSFMVKSTDFPAEQQERITAAEQLWTRKDDRQQEHWLAALLTGVAFDRFANIDIETFTYDPDTGSANCDSTGIGSRFSEDMPKWLIKGLAQLAGVKEASGCDDLVRACSFLNASAIRATCPTQCGCQDPHYGLYLSGPATGCPRERCVRTFEYTSDLSLGLCYDFDIKAYDWATDLLAPGWSRYWEEFAQVEEDGGNFYRAPDGMLAAQLKKLALQMGCDVLSNNELVATFCLSTAATGSLAPFCPMTCGCRRTPEARGCQRDCADWDRKYKASLAELPCLDMQPGSMTIASVYFDWWVWAGYRFESWTMNGILGDKFMPLISPEYIKMSYWELWASINETGCEPYLKTLCNDAAGAFNIGSLCPQLCNCGWWGSASCPGKCANFSNVTAAAGSLLFP